MKQLKWKRIEKGVYEAVHGELTFCIEDVTVAQLYGPSWKVTCGDWKEYAGSKKDCTLYANEFLNEFLIKDRPWSKRVIKN